MAVPKKKTSKSRRDMRRSHHALKRINGLGSCENCGAVRLPHNVCNVCGKYNGKQIFADKREVAQSVH